VNDREIARAEEDIAARRREIDRLVAELKEAEARLWKLRADPSAGPYEPPDFLHPPDRRG
jgi:multidrug resistance efflux pump